jgi:hypothetical protein
LLVTTADILTRICYLVNEVSKGLKELFVQDLGVGDLVQLSGAKIKDINNHGVVIGYVLEEFGVPSAIYTGHTFYFRYIPNGTLAIYLGRSVEAIHNKYFTNFHRVFSEGQECIVHEKYIYPGNWDIDKEENS